MLCRHEIGMSFVRVTRIEQGGADAKQDQGGASRILGGET